MFKLICGLGNSNIENVKALVKLYAKAGAWMFDVSPFMLPYLNSAIAEVGLNLSDFKSCISIPIEGDIHGRKAKIDQKKCVLCKKCTSNCPQNAIKPPFIEENSCIGCGICKKTCKKNAIKFYDVCDYFGEFKKIIKNGEKLDCVELHASIADKKKSLKMLKKICKIFKGEISLCISRKIFSTNEAFDLILRAKEIAKENKAFYVQADGNSMNGASSDFASSVETVAFALNLKNLGFPEKKIILSGGTNEHTPKLSCLCGLSPLAFGYGTYARKIISNLDENEALNVAKKIVKAATL